MVELQGGGSASAATWLAEVHSAVQLARGRAVDLVVWWGGHHVRLWSGSAYPCVHAWALLPPRCEPTPAPQHVLQGPAALHSQQGGNALLPLCKAHSLL